VNFNTEFAPENLKFYDKTKNNSRFIQLVYFVCYAIVKKSCPAIHKHFEDMRGT